MLIVEIRKFTADQTSDSSGQPALRVDVRSVYDTPTVDLLGTQVVEAFIAQDQVVRVTGGYVTVTAV